jgi:inosine-uridine nucleoside N-ribohydrolase
MTRYPSLSSEQRNDMLRPPTGPVHMVLDTDTYNEIDDQFALVYALLSQALTVEAVYAAPYSNNRSIGPEDGMLKSYDEILRILDMLGHTRDGFAFRGSTSYLPAKERPVVSAAAQDLIAKALAPRQSPLYVLAIGCITNVASAILLEPEIIRHIVVVWLGGQPHYWPTAREFNLEQDVPAAQVLFDCGVPVVHIPCKNVAEHLRTTVPEMERYLAGRGAIGDYLLQIFKDYHHDHYAWSKVIWDISTVAWGLNPSWVPTDLRPSPLLRDDVTWGPADAQRHLFREARDIDRDAVFGDLFRKIDAWGR